MAVPTCSLAAVWLGRRRISWICCLLHIVLPSCQFSIAHIAHTRINVIEPSSIASSKDPRDLHAPENYLPQKSGFTTSARLADLNLVLPRVLHVLSSKLLSVEALLCYYDLGVRSASDRHPIPDRLLAQRHFRMHKRRLNDFLTIFKLIIEYRTLSLQALAQLFHGLAFMKITEIN